MRFACCDVKRSSCVDETCQRLQYAGIGRIFTPANVGKSLAVVPECLLRALVADKLGKTIEQWRADAPGQFVFRRTVDPQFL